MPARRFERVVDLVRRPGRRALQVEDDRRVDVARSACPSPAPPAASAPSRCRRCGRRATAAALAPLPRCRTIRLQSASGRPSSSRGRARDVRVRGAVEAVAAHAVLARPARAGRRRCTRAAAASGGTRCRRRRRAARRAAPRRATSIPVALTGLCSGASAASVADRGHHGVVDQHGRAEALAAVDDAVRDREQVGSGRASARRAPGRSAAPWSVTRSHGPGRPRAVPVVGVDQPRTSATTTRS